MLLPYLACACDHLFALYSWQHNLPSNQIPLGEHFDFAGLTSSYVYTT